MLLQPAVTELCESMNLDPGLRRGDVQAVWVLLIIKISGGLLFRHYGAGRNPGRPVRTMPQARKSNVRKRG
jgi:hypothetical protein